MTTQLYVCMTTQYNTKDNTVITHIDNTATQYNTNVYNTTQVDVCCCLLLYVCMIKIEFLISVFNFNFEAADCFCISLFVADVEDVENEAREATAGS